MNITMKSQLSLFLILISVALSVACKKTMSGIYVNQDDPIKYLELKEDGSFYVGTMREGLYGSYELDGQLISLRFEGGHFLRGRIEGNTFAEYGGSTYVRRSTPPPVSTRENDEAAVHGLRNITTAEGTYAGTYNRGYSESLEQLGPGDQPSPTHAGLVDEALESGTKGGYHFSYTPGASAQAGITAYTVRADPVLDGVTGRMHYYAEQNEVIRYNALREAGPSDPPIPPSTPLERAILERAGLLPKP